MAKTMTKDMTKGNPWKVILMFSLPLLVGNVFQQFYNMADTIIVGNILGMDALASVGATGSINFLVLGFCMGITSGFSVPISQAFGAKDEKILRHYVGLSIVWCVIITVVVTTVAVACTRPLLTVMGTPENIYEDAYSYIVVIYAGIVATMAYNMSAGVLRALGDSKTPLYFLILSSALNIALDFLLIQVFHMGVSGAAYATVIAQGGSAILCVIYIYKKFPILHLSKEDFIMSSHLSKNMFTVGLPMALQFSVTAVGVMVLQSAINTFGSSVVGAYTAASKVENLSSQPMNTIGTAMATYCGQNLGAGAHDRIRKGMKAGFWMCVICAILGFGIHFLLGEPMIHLFVSDVTEEAVGYATEYLRIVACFFPFLSLLFLYRNALQGLNYALIPFLAGVTEFALRIIVCAAAAALVISEETRYFVICLASPAAWVGAGVLLIIRYNMYLGERKKLEVENGK